MPAKPAGVQSVGTMSLLQIPLWFRRSRLPGGRSERRFSGICESPRKLCVKSATAPKDQSERNDQKQKPAQACALERVCTALAEFIRRPQAENSNRRNRGHSTQSLRECQNFFCGWHEHPGMASLSGSDLVAAHAVRRGWRPLDALSCPRTHRYADGFQFDAITAPP